MTTICKSAKEIWGKGGGVPNQRFLIWFSISSVNSLPLPISLVAIRTTQRLTRNNQLSIECHHTTPHHQHRRHIEGGLNHNQPELTFPFTESRVLPPCPNLFPVNLNTFQSEIKLLLTQSAPPSTTKSVHLHRIAGVVWYACCYLEQANPNTIFPYICIFIITLSYPQHLLRHRVPK